MIYIINKSIIISFVAARTTKIERKKKRREKRRKNVRTINIKEADLGFPYEMTYSSRLNAAISAKETKRDYKVLKRNS